MSTVEIQKVNVTFSVCTPEGEVLRSQDFKGRLNMDHPDDDAPSKLAQWLSGIALEDAPKFFASKEKS